MSKKKHFHSVRSGKRQVQAYAFFHRPNAWARAKSQAFGILAEEATPTVPTVPTVPVIPTVPTVPRQKARAGALEQKAAPGATNTKSGNQTQSDT